MIFADASFWIALIHRKDRHHEQANALNQTLRNTPLVTTTAVLTEVLSFYGGRGAILRQTAAELVRLILRSGSIEVVELTRPLVEAGLDLCEKRPDKEYSLVDCVSMSLMRERAIFEVLSNDHHFEQEGFTLLLRSSRAL